MSDSVVPPDAHDSALLDWSSGATNERGQPLALPDERALFVPARPVTAITLGAGARGTVYGNFALAYPDNLRIVGVADPSDVRQLTYAEAHRIPPAHRFHDWRDVFARPRFADAVIVSTPDALHFDPCMAALEAGYDVLLEKPIAPTLDECRALLAKARETGRIVAVCHVLRYAPYFVKLRELLQAGAIGRLVSLQHMEPIGHVHMAHSFVRGNWRRSDTSAPIVLAKSCHDLDILRWLVGSRSEQVQAFGELTWFRAENAPAGSTARCLDGCAVEPSCPYSAARIYDRDRQRTYVFDLPPEEPARTLAILDALRTTDYGRCVYRLDNDQPDHYVANIRFRGGVTASFAMEGFTPWSGRRTRAMGSHGFIEGDMAGLEVHDFRSGHVARWDSPVEEAHDDAYSGHGGGDWRLVADWVEAVATQDAGVLSSTLGQSIESHAMAFACERSRRDGTVEAVRF